MLSSSIFERADAWHLETIAMTSVRKFDGHDLFDWKIMYNVHTPWLDSTSKYICSFYTVVGNRSHWPELICHADVNLNYDLFQLSSMEYEHDALVDCKNLWKKLFFIRNFDFQICCKIRLLYQISDTNGQPKCLS